MIGLSLFLGMLLLLSTRGYEPPRFYVKGAIKQEKGLEPASLVMINSGTGDSIDVEIDNDKFELDLEFENHYLFELNRGNQNLKKVLVSTFRPISSQDYKVKMVLDVKNLSEGGQYGLLEYNGFEGKFVSKPLLQSELRRRKYEFGQFYAALILKK